MVVRALSSSQQDFSPRNIIIHSAYGIGAILSAVTPFYGMAVTNASAAFTGAFVPSLDKYFKDHTGDQLNLLNDTGFSSSLNSQTVVPKSGSVMVVIFIPQRQFDQSWWTQRCVEQVYVGSKKNGQTTPPDKDYFVASGEQVRRALEVCAYDDPSSQDQQKANAKKKKGSLFSVPPPPSSVPPPPSSVPPPPSSVPSPPSSGSSPEQDLFRVARTLPFRSWSGTALGIFREMSDTVIAGTHIVEETALEPSIDQITCPTDAKGDLVFPQEGDKISCTVTGKNLYKFGKLRLRNAKDASDTTTVEGTLTISGESETGTVTFSTESLRALGESAYEVFGVTGNGIEQKTSQVVHFEPSAYATDISPQEIDCTKSQDVPLTVSGFHLDKIDSLQLSSAEGEKPIKLAIKRAISTEKKAFFDFPVKDRPKLKDGEGYDLELQSGKDSFKVTGHTLKCIGAQADKPGKTKPTTADDSKKATPSNKKKPAPAKKNRTAT